MSSIRLQVLDQICKTPGKTCKRLSMDTGINLESVRGAIYTLEADRLIRKVSGTKPYAYELDKLRMVAGKQLPAFAESLRGRQQVTEYTRTWKPARDMGEFLRSLRA